MILFEEILVWKSLDNTSATRYSCFKNLENGKYCVQSADFFHHPLNDDQMRQSEKQLAELFIDTSPLERNEWFDSLKEAILFHDKEFSS